MDLMAQIAQEADEIKNAPVVPFSYGFVGRCHICGRMRPLNQLQKFDTHLDAKLHRKACELCHPDRKT